jgi:DNA-binding NarL/FixJ family response regulator
VLSARGAASAWQHLDKKVAIHGAILDHGVPTALQMAAALRARDSKPVVLVAAQGPDASLVNRICLNDLGMLWAGDIDAACLDTVIDRAASRLDASAPRAESPVQPRWEREAPSFTPREDEVFALAVAGFDEKEMAAGLGLSPHTVRDHLRSLRHKTGIHCIRELGRRVRSGEPLPGPRDGASGGGRGKGAR